jgi:hypothetical protein
MSLTLDKTIPTVAALLASPLAKYITLAANDCGYSGKAEELIVTYVHPLLLQSHSQLVKLTILVKFAGEYWKVMKLKIATLEAIDAWSVIDCFDHHVIGSTWAFKCKQYPDGLIKKFKARFCARGDKQLKQTDFVDTYANDPKTLKALEVREDSLVESPANPKLEPPVDPRVKPIMVQARTKADP